MKRGEVWWADLPLPIGRRPVVLLTRESVYRSRTSVTVAPITRTIRRIPTEVPLSRADGMREDCVVNTDDLHTVRMTSILRRITELSPDRMEEIAVAIAYALDLPFGY